MKGLLFLSLLLLLGGCGTNNHPGMVKSDDDDIRNFLLKKHDFKIPEKFNEVLILPRSGCRYCMQYALKAINEERLRDDVVILVIDHPEDVVSTPKYNDALFFTDMQEAFSYGLSVFTLSIYEQRRDGTFHRKQPTAEEFHSVFDELTIRK